MAKAVVYCFGRRGARMPAGAGLLLGQKAADLAAMARAGLATPPGFVLTREAWLVWRRRRRAGSDLRRAVGDGIAWIEKVTGRNFANRNRPLLLAVRCGAVGPMPGLMPAVLNVGLNEQALCGLASERGPDFANDCYGRLICALGEARGIERSAFEDAIQDQPDAPSAICKCVEVWKRELGETWPADPWDQLWMCIQTAMESWDSPVAQAHRKRAPSADPGVAVTIQAMVFGNRNEQSGAGQVCTRDPSTGENTLRGQYAAGAQGTDAWQSHAVKIDALAEESPNVWRQIRGTAKSLERLHRDAVDFCFTVEDGRVWVLRSRPMRRSGAAAARIAVDLARAKVIDRAQAVMRVEPAALEQALHPRLDVRGAAAPIATGFAASPGAAAGQIAFEAEEAMRRARAGETIVLVRPETEPSDIAAMELCAGILTSTGGMTSHAAVVARGMGKPCVVGANALNIDVAGRRLSVSGQTLGAQDWISLDGARGEIYAGKISAIEPELSDSFRTILDWADKLRTMRVLANADTPRDAAAARRFGAQGIGLCRTEHMFFAPDRIAPMRRMILAETADERRAALAELLPHQREDFAGIFRAMDGLPVTIRLLDPPLHEFLGNATDADPRIARRIEQLREANPMLGHRGCRLCITYPEILEMQVRAIIEAACACASDAVKVRPRIMMPLVMDAREMAILAGQASEVAEVVMKEQGARVKYSIGTMIETPRAALTAADIAQHVDFLSFGTNDLTQMTMGISRDDAGSYLGAYIEKRILPRDPFAGIDQSGVGQLMRLALAQVNASRPTLTCGICGEHGGDPASIAFCHKLGLYYTSCSPYRVPVARLAAAQAAIAPIRRRN